MSESLALLKSIDASLKTLVRVLAPKGQAGAVADDRDLDGKYGDPELRFMPRDWTGESYKGLRFSQCPPDLLDLVAQTFDYFADKAEETGETYKDKPVAPYKRKDAARARGWAARIRSGRVQQAAPPAAPDWSAPPTDDDIPF